MAMRMRGTKCPLHLDKMQDIYCHTCEQPVCLRCMFANHRHHDCTELEMAARRKREILRKVSRAIMELLSKLRSRYDNIADVTECAQNLREKGNDVDVVLNTPGLRRRFGDATGTERDLTKLPGWPEHGAHADKLRQYLAGQQVPGGQQFPGGQRFSGGQQFPGGQPGGQAFLGGQASAGGQQFSGGQQLPGGQQFLPCPMCPGRIPCNESRQGLLMICHCKHQPAEGASKGK